MSNTKVVLLILAIFLMNAAMNIGCASNPHKAVELNTKVDLAAQAGNNQLVGVKNGEMIVQRKVLMSEELRLLQNDAYNLEAHVYGGTRYFDNNGLWGSLRMCRQKTAIHEDGKLAWQEPREYVIPSYEDSTLGIDESKNIVGVEEEYLKDRIARFRKYKDILESRKTEYENKIAVCETNLKYTVTQSEK